MSIIAFNKTDIESNIATVAKAEKVTKAVLSILSRDLLAYVYETNDVAMVTRLIDVLTPVNKKVALMYFPAFLGWCFNEKTGAFGKKAKDKTFNKKYESAVAWLDVESNDIWKWAEDELVLQVKPKNYAAKITQLVTKALGDEEEGIEMKDLLFAIMASDAVTLADLMAPLAELKDLPLEDA